MSSFFLNIHYHLEHIALRIFLIFAENLPIRISHGIACIIGKIAYFFATKRRKRIQENLEIAYPDGIPFPVKEFTKKVFLHAIYVFFELALSKRLFHKHTWQNYVTGDELKIFKEILESNSAIICSGHLGNFAILGHLVSYSNVPTLTVIRELYNPMINTLFIEMLGRSGNQVVLKEKAYETFLEVIPKGIYPGILIDQHAGKKALFVPFMGKKAYTAASPAVLSMKFGIPVYLIALVREDFFRFHFLGRKVFVENLTGDRQKDLEIITTNINQALESLIKMYPEQWFWMHRRWRD